MRLVSEAEIRAFLMESRQVTPRDLVSRFKERLTTKEERDVFGSILNKIAKKQKNQASQIIVVLKDNESFGSLSSSELTRSSIPSPPEIKQDEEEEEGGLSKSGKELKKFLGKANGLNESDEEEDDDSGDVSKGKRKMNLIQKKMNLMSVPAKPATSGPSHGALPAKSSTMYLRNMTRMMNLMQKKKNLLSVSAKSGPSSRGTPPAKSSKMYLRNMISMMNLYQKKMNLMSIPIKRAPSGPSSRGTLPAKTSKMNLLNMIQMMNRMNMIQRKMILVSVPAKPAPSGPSRGTLPAKSSTMYMRNMTRMMNLMQTKMNLMSIPAKAASSGPSRGTLPVQRKVKTENDSKWALKEEKTNSVSKSNTPSKSMRAEPVAAATRASSSSVATGPVTEDEIRAFLMEKKQVTTQDLVSRFKARIKTKEDKIAFANILRKISKIQKNADSQKIVVLKEK